MENIDWGNTIAALLALSVVGIFLYYICYGIWYVATDARRMKEKEERERQQKLEYKGNVGRIRVKVCFLDEAGIIQEAEKSYVGRVTDAFRWHSDDWTPDIYPANMYFENDLAHAKKEGFMELFVPTLKSDQTKTRTFVPYHHIISVKPGPVETYFKNGMNNGLGLNKEDDPSEYS